MHRERNARRAVFFTQAFRPGLTYVAPTALFVTSLIFFQRQFLQSEIFAPGFSRLRGLLALDC